jgi:hypothetical protein
LEGWKVGRLEGWKVGRLEGWKVGRLEGWKVGRLGAQKIFFSSFLAQKNDIIFGLIENILVCTVFHSN